MEKLRDLQRQLEMDPHDLDTFFRYYVELFRRGLYSVFRNSIEQAAPGSDGGPIDLLARICYEKTYLPVVKDLGLKGGTQLAPMYHIYVVTKRPVPCYVCQALGPHLCNQLRMSSNYDVPQNYRDLGLEEPLKLWESKLENRRKGQTYYYEIIRWYFRPPKSNSGDVFQNWRTATSRVDSWHDSNTLPYITLEDSWRKHNMELVPENCQVLFDYTNQVFPIITEHQELEQPPEVLVGPCSKFQILPPGGEIWIKELQQYVPTGKVATVWTDELIPQVERVIDTTTACGHGHNEGFPLCPPVWSDTGKPAARHCELCTRLVPLAGDTRFVVPKDAPGTELSKRARRRQLQKDALNRLVICVDCQARTKRQEELQGQMEDDTTYPPGDYSSYKIYYCPECEASTSDEDEEWDEEEEQEEKEIVDEPCEDCGTEMLVAYQCPFCKTNCETLAKMAQCCTKIIPWNFGRLS